MPKKLHIDVETYSSVELKNSGRYKYCNSIDFDILMIAYAYDDEPVKIVDLMEGEEIPQHFIDSLLNPEIEKHAYNAAFERGAFDAYGYVVPAKYWFCTMIKAAYCGLPLGLGNVAKALKFGEDKAKKATGRALIKYFCIPCKPTKKNGYRTRNFPYHDPEKWEALKEYCLQDVEAERAIERSLQNYEIPNWERENYILDQKINDYGITVDLSFAAKCQKIDLIHKARLIQEMKEITGVENPNSPAQLKGWLSQRLNRQITTLAKDKLSTLINNSCGAVNEVLQLRAMGSKTSTGKYKAMLNCAAIDNRVRGLFQFYGASRTGRWAGRLVQLQNLPQNRIKDLDETRNRFKELDYEDIRLFDKDVSSQLSQLIRTAFIAPEGKVFCVADFSAIEARVTAWFAGEQWRLDVFNDDGKIYEASASAMFNVPLELCSKAMDETNKLRSRGKVAELALGFGGGVTALETMGGAKMGLTPPEMKAIVKKWRKASPNIVKFWRNVEKAAKLAVKTRKVYRTNKLVFQYDKRVLTVTLPSGRKLFYYGAGIRLGRFGDELYYWGVNSTTKQWSTISTYGGKLVENIVQGTARDLLADSMQRIDNNEFTIAMHVHDEAVTENDIDSAEEDLEKLCAIMGTPISWAKGLPLVADGYITPYYKKD